MPEERLGEFDLIDRFFNRASDPEPFLDLGIGDDAAIVRVPENKRLCLSVDTVVEGVHFPKDFPPEHIATRALGSALSDLAAMGASPSHFTLAITLPDSRVAWLEAFASALMSMASEYGVRLVGGDTTRGPLAISVQVHGWLPEEQSLRRDAVKPGDLLVVSGTLGDAAAGLRSLEAGQDHGNHEFLLDRFSCPRPRIELSLALLGLANAAIDISDGLMKDAEHLALSSGVQLVIEVPALPVSSGLAEAYPEDFSSLALSGGDDYEVLYSISREAWAMLPADLQAQLTVIGHALEGEPLVQLVGLDSTIETKGFQHFE